MEDIIFDAGDNRGLHSNDPNQTAFIFKCTYLTQKAIVKIAHGSDKLNNNSLETERWIYKNIIPNILERVPGRVVKSLGSFKSAKKPDHWPEIRGITWGSGNTIHALVLERVEGVTLRELLETTSNTDIQSLLNDVLLQCAAVLDAFQRVGLMHNDLHCGNVFVQELDTPEKWTWSQHEFKTKWRVKIYDFDHASKTPTTEDPQLMENTWLTKVLCKSSCECNNFTTGFDWWGLLQGLYYDLTTSKLRGAKQYRKYLKELVPGIATEILPAILRNGVNYTGMLLWTQRPCTCKEATCTTYTIQQNWLRLLKPPSVYLETKGGENDVSKDKNQNMLPQKSATKCGAIMVNNQVCKRPKDQCQYHKKEYRKSG